LILWRKFETQSSKPGGRAASPGALAGADAATAIDDGIPGGIGFGDVGGGDAQAVSVATASATHRGRRRTSRTSSSNIARF
jgi:hypothetical protein